MSQSSTILLCIMYLVNFIRNRIKNIHSYEWLLVKMNAAELSHNYSTSKALPLHPNSHSHIIFFRSSRVYSGTKIKIKSKTIIISI